MLSFDAVLLSGADPGFPVGGGANPLGGRQHMILPNFAKNCMKLRKFWAVGGAPPLNPPLIVINERNNFYCNV